MLHPAEVLTNISQTLLTRVAKALYWPALMMKPGSEGSTLLVLSGLFFMWWIVHALGSLAPTPSRRQLRRRSTTGVVATAQHLCVAGGPARPHIRRQLGRRARTGAVAAAQELEASGSSRSFQSRRQLVAAAWQAIATTRRPSGRRTRTGVLVAAHRPGAAGWSRPSSSRRRRCTAPD